MATLRCLTNSDRGFESVADPTVPPAAVTSPNPVYSQSLTEGRTIRLIILHPGTWNDEIECTIFQSSLGEDLYYEALSYVWGSPVNPVGIILNNGRHQPHVTTITRNLHFALRRLRYRGCSRTLWVDALCINQLDNKERTHQVAIMDLIYSFAKQVVIPLGEVEDLAFSSPWDDPTANQADQLNITFGFDESDRFMLKHSRVLNEAIRTKGSERRTRHADPAADVFCLLRLLAEAHDFSGFLGDDTSSASITRRLESSFEFMRQVLRSKWWSRIWVVQEAVVPARLSVTYGSCTAPWPMFTAAASHLRAGTSILGTRHLAQGYRKVLDHYSRTVLDLENLREQWRSGKRMDLLTLMNQFSNRAASDDRDKIFALRGLATDSNLIAADYSTSVAETYKEVALRMIDASMSLNVVIGTVGTKIRMDLPSWTPDWSSSYNTVNSMWSRSTSLYDASKGIAAVLQDFNMKCPSQTPERHAQLSRMIEDGMAFAPVQPCAGGAIRLPRYKVGTIKWVGEPYLCDEDRLSTMRSWWLSVSREPAYSESPANRDRFLRTICADVFYTDAKTEGRQPRRMNDSDLKRPFPLYRGIQKSVEEELDAEAELSIRFAATRRRFFLTDNGTMGLAPLDTRARDLIFILPGGRTPFVLRKGRLMDRPAEAQRLSVFDGHSDEFVLYYRSTSRIASYSMVGDCYAHGFMDGEAIIDCKPEARVSLPSLTAWVSSVSFQNGQSYEEEEVLKCHEVRKMVEDFIVSGRSPESYGHSCMRFLYSQIPHHFPYDTLGAIWNELGTAKIYLLELGTTRFQAEREAGKASSVEGTKVEAGARARVAAMERSDFSYRARAKRSVHVGKALGRKSMGR
ncbi:hypothetical protein FKW77_009687 [Venturia effusa]|uniref:Heterokaryon incompatibility domain-containing protein n=1 Tax=Venturia effusa TaxID=50376 RepID=A0A517KXC9_9PEZI|nr:hypothetical protein FKW77_009687 [Venturia effusa]